MLVYKLSEDILAYQVKWDEQGLILSECPLLLFKWKYSMSKRSSL